MRRARARVRAQRRERVGLGRRFAGCSAARPGGGFASVASPRRRLGVAPAAAAGAELEAWRPLPSGRDGRDGARARRETRGVGESVREVARPPSRELALADGAQHVAAGWGPIVRAASLPSPPRARGGAHRRSSSAAARPAKTNWVGSRDVVLLAAGQRPSGRCDFVSGSLSRLPREPSLRTRTSSRRDELVDARVRTPSRAVKPSRLPSARRAGARDRRAVEVGPKCPSDAEGAVGSRFGSSSHRRTRAAVGVAAEAGHGRASGDPP